MPVVQITGKLSTKDTNRNVQQDKPEISNDNIGYILSMINGGRPSLKNENYIFLSNNQPQYDSTNNDYKISSSISSPTNSGGKKSVVDQTTGGSKTQRGNLIGGEQNYKRLTRGVIQHSYYFHCLIRDTT
jgi:hypothetical protein